MKENNINNITKEDVEETIELRTMKALIAAKEAFKKCLEDEGYDPAYWDIRFTAWELDANLEHRTQRYEIEGEVKE
jgi:hypothetical protein